LRSVSRQFGQPKRVLAGGEQLAARSSGLLRPASVGLGGEQTWQARSRRTGSALLRKFHDSGTLRWHYPEVDRCPGVVLAGRFAHTLHNRQA
ncbi:hypothetical protein ACFL5O_09880, partial [Myxococcota bacterium]